MRVALYARVSTTRQADTELSIPDQLRQMREHCQRQGHSIIREYEEPGASATDDKRPVFQTMLADAKRDPSPYEAIIVYNFSRFYRDLIGGAVTKRSLKKYG